MTSREPFYARAFVTFYVALSFLVLAVSGLVLFIAPPGRIANWSKWNMAWLTKADWQAVHTIFAILFIVVGSLHLYFNWRVILNYVKSKLAGGGLRRGRELALATGTGVVVLAATVAGLPPFSTVMSISEEAKNAWSTTASEPPVPHAEAWSVARFAENTKLPVEKVIGNLARHNVRVESPEVTLQALARAREVTPKEIYDWALAGAQPAAAAGFAAGAGHSPAGAFVEGGGFGRRTVQQLCDQVGVSGDEGLSRLQAAGITGAKASTTLRELAQEHGRTPIEIAELIRGK